MENIEDSLHVQRSDLKPQPRDAETFGDLNPCNERFDASQYDFFGKDLSQDAGLEELEDGQFVLEEEDDTLLGEEVDNSELVSELDDTSEFERSFTQRLSLKSDGETRSLNVLDGQPGSVEKGYVNTPNQPREMDLQNCVHRTNYGIQADQEGQKWFPYHPEPAMHDLESKGFQRPTYPQQHKWLGTEPQFSQVAHSMSNSYPSARPQTLQSQSPGHFIPPATPTPHGPLPSNYRSQIPPQSQSYMGGIQPSFVHYDGVIPHYHASGHVLNVPSPQGQWLPHSGMQPGGPTSIVSNLMQQQIAHQNVLLPSQVLLHRPGIASSPYAHSRHLYNLPLSTPPLMHKPSDNFSAGDSIDQRNESQQRVRQTQQHYQQSSSNTNKVLSRNNGWQQFKSKYMTAEEIESILRIQLAATHSSDPYIDDYYHEAVQTKIIGGATHGRHHFAPNRLRDLTTHTRAAAEPHTFLQVDALGRVPFSSLRRPRPLLEVDTTSGVTGISEGTNEGLQDMKSSERPLEQEPMLAARIAIEDGLSILLDVDDIDRLLTVSQPPDTGAQLRRRRQYLLESLAASLQLVDPLAHSGSNGGIHPISGGGIGRLNPVFLRLASLPKGRKLLGRYLQLLPLGSELVRLVCVGVFRHLQFFFGSTQTDASATAATTGLGRTVADCVTSMDLTALSTCVVAVALSSEQPPLRPVGSTSGDGATVILRSVLDRATQLLTDPSKTYPIQDRDLWQASFNAFFGILSRYCTNKYDSIIHSLMMSSPGNVTAINSAAAIAMSKEMPVELLRASLPHTNELQRRQLLEFAQRSMVMGGLNSHTSSDGLASTAAVPG